MAKQKITYEYYTLDRILQTGSKYNLIMGQRKNGKTYAVKKRIVDKVALGGKFAYIRRKRPMITRRKMEKLFSDMQDYCEQKLGSVIFYDGEGNFCIHSDEGKKIVGTVHCIKEAYLSKGIPSDCKIILYDEFIDYDYFDDEEELFWHTIGNLVREDNQECEIFMLGNTINKYCPYFEYFGFDITKLKQGDIAVVHNPKGGTASVEYCNRRVSKNVGKDEYFGFNRLSTDMITMGEWEYQKCNTKSVDGISWSYKERRLINCYITGLQNVYEMSLKKGRNPIAFIRQVNTQQGKVRREIKYNLSFDKSVILVNVDETVPMYIKLSDKLMDKDIVESILLVEECIECGRAIFENVRVGNEFTKALNEILKR